MLREFETCGMRLSERRALEKRWRVERRRSVPSESAVFRYLERFHDAGEEAKREAHRAFIPAPNGAMKGLRKVNADLAGCGKTPRSTQDSKWLADKRRHIAFSAPIALNELLHDGYR